MRKGASGFTLAEILFTTIIVAILAGAGAPFFASVYQSYRFDGAVQRVAGDLRLAQSLVVSKGGCYGLHFGSDPQVNLPNQYRIEKGNCDGTGWPAAATTIAASANVITNWYNLPSDYPGITLASVQDNGGTAVNGVYFNSLGATVNPFVAIATPVNVTLSNASGVRRVLQVRPTGSVQTP